MSLSRKPKSAVILSLILLGGPEVEAQNHASFSGKQEPQPLETSQSLPQTKVILKEGTEIHLKLAQKLTSKTASVGEPVEFVLADDLKVGEDMVARKGARALGTVVLGKKSEKQKNDASQLSMRFDHMRVGSTVIGLRGEQSVKGKRSAGKMVGFGILFGVSGVLGASGKKFLIPEGTPATAYVDHDTELVVLSP